MSTWEGTVLNCFQVFLFWLKEIDEADSKSMSTENPFNMKRTNWSKCLEQKEINSWYPALFIMNVLRNKIMKMFYLERGGGLGDCSGIWPTLLIWNLVLWCKLATCCFSSNLHLNYPLVHVDLMLQTPAEWQSYFTKFWTFCFKT